MKIDLKFAVFTIICLVCCLSTVIGQQSYSNSINILDKKESSLLKSYPEILREKDSLKFVNFIESDLLSLWGKGYLLANLDTVYSEGDNYHADIYIGEAYQFGNIEVSENYSAIVRAAGLKNVRWKEKLVSSAMIEEYAETLLTYLEDHGYPFSSVQLDSTIIQNGKVQSKLILDRNQYVPFDTLEIKGEVDIRPGYLKRYLNIKAGEPYNRSRINDIQKRIGNLTFLQLDSTPIIKFANDKAEVQLYMQPKKASRFDFLIGVLPSSNNGERRFSIIGEFTGEMYNKLGQGEYIFANVQSRPETRILEVRFNYPYLADLPLGVDFSGRIFFNEEFRETVWDGGILYQFDGGSSLKASWTNKTSRLIDVDTASILLTKKLPNQLDVTFNGGSLEYAMRNLDYRFNPTKGWEMRLNGSVGIRRIIKNNTIEELSRPGADFNLAYDTLDLSTLQTEVKLSAAAYLPAFNVATFKFGLEGGLLYNQQQIYENELYRIGGNALLRGFDELSVLTSTYLVSTAEFRLLLDRNSFLSFPFIDYGITKLSQDGEEFWDTTISLGMGINFATPAGIFNVTFAAGRRLGNPIDLGNTKIHFGYVSLF